MTINGILQLLSTDENLCTVQIESDLFSLNQIRQVVKFQEHVNGYLHAEDWWKYSKNLTGTSRLTPDLSNLPHVTLITPPYTFPQDCRIGDVLEITRTIASRILETKATFCVHCSKINRPESLDSIISGCNSDALAISALASSETLSSHIFPKIIEGNEIKDFEEISPPTSPLEVLIDRVKLSNPDREIRIQRALDFIAKHSLTDAFIHSWPLGAFKHKVELSSNCRECGTPFLPAMHMLQALTSAIWTLSGTDHPLLQELYNPLSSTTNLNFEILEKLKINHHSPAVLLKNLDPAHLHIIKIQQCILKAPENPVFISPFNYLLPSRVSDHLFTVLKKSLSPGTRIIAALLPQNTDKDKKTTARYIFPGKIPELIEPGSRSIIELNRATIDEQTYCSIEHALPENYKIYSLPHAHSRNSQRTRVVSYLGILPHIARLYADHPTARALGLSPKFFSHDAFTYSCTFCGGSVGQCTICKGRPFPPDIYLVKFKGKSLARLLEEEMVGAIEIIGKIPKASTILKAAVEFGLGSLRLNQTLSEINLLEQWLLRILKFFLQTPVKSAIILPDLRWCLNNNQSKYVEQQIVERQEAKGIVFETNMKLDVE